MPRCSGRVELEWTNDFRTVAPKTRSNTMAVVDKGFGKGKAIWAFRLDRVRVLYCCEAAPSPTRSPHRSPPPYRTPLAGQGQ